LDETLRKTLFWDYDIRALDRLPAVVRAQRYVDLWPVVDQALVSGQANLADLRAILDVGLNRSRGRGWQDPA
jgi:hypothetical protein